VGSLVYNLVTEIEKKNIRNIRHYRLRHWQQNNLRPISLQFIFKCCHSRTKATNKHRTNTTKKLQMLQWKPTTANTVQNIVTRL